MLIPCSTKRCACVSPGAASCGAAPHSDCPRRRSAASFPRPAAPAPRPRAAAFIQERQLNTLQATYFVPAGQDFFTQVAQDWGSQNDVAFTTDYIGWPDLQPRIAAAVEGGSGADIIEMWDTWPYLYYENMVPVDDLVAAVSEEYGGFYDWVINTASVDGKWYSVPHGSSSGAFAYRISLVEEAGIADPKNNFPKTWEELFALGKTLKEMGKPFGQALGQSLGDPPSFAYPYMWAYGAMEVEEDGTTVAINKPEFVEALQNFTQVWKDAYDETGLSWDDGANNRAFLSDQISGTFNGSSIYIAAVNAKKGESTLDYEVLVDPDDIWHAGYPDGPAGRFNLLGSRSMAAMSYSPNAEAAVEFLAVLLHAGGLHPLAGGAAGVHHPDGAGIRRSGDVHGEPGPRALHRSLRATGATRASPARPTRRRPKSFSRYVIVNAIAQAIQSGDAAGAVQQAEAQLQRIYGG